MFRGINKSFKQPGFRPVTGMRSSQAVSLQPIVNKRDKNSIHQQETA
jgi:hypothetical protein